MGYTDKLTVRPGEQLEFKVSVEGGGRYTAQLVRLINGDVYSEAANFKELEIESPINGRYEGRQQCVVPGSCVVVEGLAPLNSVRELTIVVNVMPTMPGRGMQHLISRWDERAKAGWSLHLNEQGELAFASGDARSSISSVVISEPLTAKTWHTVALRVSWKSRTAKLDCKAIARTRQCGNVLREATSFTEQLGACPDVTCPLFMGGAFGGRDESGRAIPLGCFNGRLEAPVIYRGILSDREIDEVATGERPLSLSAQLLADWDFSDGIQSTRIKDRSRNQLDAYTHNLPSRAVRGSRWNGSTMEWRHAPDQYAAIHFHTDDLYDCGWVTDICYRVPDRLPSGIYALRLRRDAACQSIACEEYLPFFVAAPRGAAQATIAFLLPTFSYLAYANMRFLEPIRKARGLPERKFYSSVPFGPGTMEYGMFAEEHVEFGLSLYDRHVDGSPVHFSSWLRPLLNVRPKSILWGFCADLLTIDWLEAKGFKYDIVTDDLLHAEGVDLLKSYSVVVTGNHPEYVTTSELDAIESYLGSGGRLMYLGGNGYYWRVAADESAIEVRRGRTGTGPWQSEVGESCFALSGEVGAIWRDLGRPPQQLVGVGFIAEATGASYSSYYRVVPDARQSPAGFILQGVDGDIIGDFGIFAGGAAGQEIDKTNAIHGTPTQAVIVARSEAHSPDMLYVIEEMSSAYPVIDTYRSLTFAEVAYFETRQGGAVFSVGSMAWCGSLSHNGYNNNVSTITANVLKRFSEQS